MYGFFCQVTNHKTSLVQNGHTNLAFKSIFRPDHWMRRYREYTNLTNVVRVQVFKQPVNIFFIFLSLSSCSHREVRESKQIRDEEV